MTGYLIRRCAAVAALAFAAHAPAAHADSNPYVGEIIIVPYTFCPLGFSEANGAALSIAQSDILFALYGTTYGGDGQTTFNLPNLQSRIPIHQGTGPGLPNFTLAQSGGTESVTLTTSNLPSHTHLVQATNATANSGGPGDKILATGANDVKIYSLGPPNKIMKTDMIASSGGNQPVSRHDPYLAMRFCVSEYGIFPSQN